MAIPNERREEFEQDWRSMSIRQIAVKYGVCPGSVYDRARYWNLPAKTERKGEVTLPELPDTEDPVLVDDLMQKLIALQKTQQALSDVLTDVSISINDDRPAGILFWGDWHLGGAGTDHEGFLEVVKDVASTPGLYTVLMGDYKDNLAVSPHQGASFEEIAGPSWQDRLVIRHVEKIKDSVLALCRGCHDDWSHRSADIDFVSTIAKTAQAINLGHGGTIRLNLSGAEYMIRARHNYPFKSRLNPTNSQRRQIDFQGEADIVAHAHLHFAQVDYAPKSGRLWIGLRSGTHKIQDEYGSKLAGWEGMELFPMVILFPREKKMIPYLDYREGLGHLNLLRSNQQVKNVA